MRIKFMADPTRSARAAQRVPPTESIRRDLDVFARIQLHTEAELVALAFEASERDAVVDLPAVDATAVDLESLHAKRVLRNERIAYERTPQSFGDRFRRLRVC